MLVALALGVFASLLACSLPFVSHGPLVLPVVGTLVASSWLLAVVFAVVRMTQHRLMRHTVPRPSHGTATGVLQTRFIDIALLAAEA